MINLPNHSYCTTEIPKEVKVGAYSSIAENVYFHSNHDNHLCARNKKCVYTTNWDQGEEKGQTIVGSDVWIGREARIMYGVHIGDGAIVGAYTVVSKDVPAFAVVVGNPGEVVRYRFDTDQMKKLLKYKWWKMDDDKVEKLKPFMKDIDVFLLKCEEYD